MKKYNKILFIGFRCVGKSSVSRYIASKINYKLYDTDKEIEKEQKKTINEITNNGKNWELFRNLELSKIKQLLQLKNIVISGGGGLGVNNIIYNNTTTYGDLQQKEILNNKETYKILLIANEKTIRERLYNNKIKSNNRPDLGKISTNIDEYLDNNIKIMKERENKYRKMANIIFDTSKLDFSTLHTNILDNLNKIIENI